MKKVIFLSTVFLLALLVPQSMQGELRHYEVSVEQQEQQLEKKERQEKAKHKKQKRGFFQKLFKPKQQNSSGAATAGLILGALGLFCLLLVFATGSGLLLLISILGSIGGLVASIIGLQSANRGSAIAGLIMSIVTFVILILLFALAAAVLASL